MAHLYTAFAVSKALGTQHHRQIGLTQKPSAFLFTKDDQGEFYKEA